MQLELIDKVKLAEKESDIAQKIEDLPTLQEGWVRVVHITKAPDHTIQKIKKDGLDYGIQGILRSTANAYSKESQVEYFSSDPRFSGPGAKAIVFDLPAQEHRLHESFSAPGILPAKYLVGIIDVSQKS